MAICISCGESLNDKNALIVNGQTYCTKAYCIDSAFRPVGEIVKATKALLAKPHPKRG